MQPTVRDSASNKTPASRRLRLWPIGVLLLVLLALFARGRWLLVQAGSLLIVEDEPVASDLVAVISGGLPEIHYGIDLYHQGFGSKLLFIGDVPVQLAVISEEPFDVMEKPWDEIAAHVAVTAGVARQDLLLADGLSQSTYLRVKQIVDIAHENELQSIIVVCDLLHSARVNLVLRKVLREAPTVALVSPTPQNYYPPQYRFSRETWWQSEADVKYLFEEWVKMIYYWLRYGVLA